MAAADKPIKTVRNGNIRAAIWRNETANGVMFNVTLSRRYRDKDGTWKSTSSLSQNDLGSVVLATIAAHLWIQSVLAQQRNPQPV